MTKSDRPPAQRRRNTAHPHRPRPRRARRNRSAARGSGGVDLRGELAAPDLVQDIAALRPCEPGPDDGQESRPPHPAASGMHRRAHARQRLRFVAVSDRVLLRHEPPGEWALPPRRERRARQWMPNGPFQLLAVIPIRRVRCAGRSKKCVGPATASRFASAGPGRASVVRKALRGA